MAINYSPAVKIVLSEKKGRWSVHRTVEKSAFLPEGLFVNTMIFIKSLQLTSFDEQRELLERSYNLADQAVGLTYMGDKGDGSVC